MILYRSESIEKGLSNFIDLIDLHEVKNKDLTISIDELYSVKNLLERTLEGVRESNKQ